MDKAVSTASPAGRGHGKALGIGLHDFAGDNAGNALQQMDIEDRLCAAVREVAHVQTGIGPDVHRAVVVEKNAHPACGVGIDGIGQENGRAHAQLFRASAPRHACPGNKFGDCAYGGRLRRVKRRGGNEAKDDKKTGGTAHTKK
jgi:hypothetical protein